MNDNHMDKEIMIREYGEWKIDHTTGVPILMYKKCSVIQDEQAEYLFSLIIWDKERKNV